MNENIKETNEALADILPDNNGLFGNVSDNNGNSSPTVSNGDIGYSVNNTPNGYASSSNAWTGSSNNVGYPYSTGSSNNLTLDYTETLLQITESQKEQTEILTGISSVLILIFAFLLLEWTEKKINVISRRFSNRRK